MNFCKAFLLQLALLAIFEGFGWKAMAFQALLPRPHVAATPRLDRPFSSSVRVYRTASKWDNLVDEDDEEEYIPGPPDMKYIPRNVGKSNPVYSL